MRTGKTSAWVLVAAILGMIAIGLNSEAFAQGKSYPTKEVNICVGPPPGWVYEYYPPEECLKVLKNDEAIYAREMKKYGFIK